MSQLRYSHISCVYIHNITPAYMELFHFKQDGDTALLLACRYGHSSVAKLMIDNEANVNYQNELNVRH